MKVFLDDFPIWMKVYQTECDFLQPCPLLPLLSCALRCSGSPSDDPAIPFPLALLRRREVPRRHPTTNQVLVVEPNTGQGDMAPRRVPKDAMREGRALHFVHPRDHCGRGGTQRARTSPHLLIRIHGQPLHNGEALGLGVGNSRPSSMCQ